MATKIRFRAKDALGFWRYGDLLQLDADTCIIVENYGAVFQSANELGIDKGGGALYSYVQKNTICQYVDSRPTLLGGDQDVYSGDIVRGYRIGSGSNPEHINFVVEHIGNEIRARKCGKYEQHNNTTDYVPLSELICDVIGNVYDNKELLKR